MIRFLVVTSLAILFLSIGNVLVFSKNWDTPFGDKDTTHASIIELLGKVRDVDFGKNADGSWHIKKCQLETVTHRGAYLVDIFFKEPYPSHQNLKKGDWICVTTGQYLINSRGYIGGYKDSELYENFTESAKECTVKPPNERMHANVVLDTSRRPRPSPDEMRWAMELAQQYVELQCVVVALQYMENPDLNPDHDYDIVSAVLSSNVVMAISMALNFFPVGSRQNTIRTSFGCQEKDYLAKVIRSLYMLNQTFPLARVNNPILTTGNL